MSDKITDARVLEVENEEGQRFALINLWVEVIGLRAENERLSTKLSNTASARILQGKAIAELSAENERLRAALKECEEELDGYYHQDYPTDHPYHQRKLKVALQGNPARAALKENSDE